MDHQSCIRNRFDTAASLTCLHRYFHRRKIHRLDRPVRCRPLHPHHHPPPHHPLILILILIIQKVVCNKMFKTLIRIYAVRWVGRAQKCLLLQIKFKIFKRALGIWRWYRHSMCTGTQGVSSPSRLFRANPAAAVRSRRRTRRLASTLAGLDKEGEVRSATAWRSTATRW